ncbi:hypothetical protein SDC9_180353 [bioreactor metagenome]|uniref:Uncharacterized protein n=1 Tax=bioreactor metagenome TaxID=1076179 RepID=A0A645H2G5_9ZZZZ
MKWPRTSAPRGGAAALNMRAQTALPAPFRHRPLPPCRRPPARPAAPARQGHKSYLKTVWLRAHSARAPSCPAAAAGCGRARAGRRHSPGPTHASNPAACRLNQTPQIRAGAPAPRRHPKSCGGGPQGRYSRSAFLNRRRARCEKC